MMRTVSLAGLGKSRNLTMGDRLGSVELMVRSEWGMRRQEGRREGQGENSVGRHEVSEKYRSEGRDLSYSLGLNIDRMKLTVK